MKRTIFTVTKVTQKMQQQNINSNMYIRVRQVSVKRLEVTLGPTSFFGISGNFLVGPGYHILFMKRAFSVYPSNSRR